MRAVHTMTKLMTLVPLLTILAGVSMSPAYGRIMFLAPFSVQPSQVIDPSLTSGSVFSHSASVPSATTANNVHTFYLGSSIVDSCSGKCENLSTSTGAADTATSQLLGKVVGKYPIEPDTGSTTTTGTPSTSSVSGYAWVYNTDLGGLTIQSGTWTFDLTLTVSTTSANPVGNVWITVWNCNTNGLGSCTFLFKNWDNATNVLATTTTTKYTYTTGTLGPFSNIHFISVEYWISYTVVGNSPALTVAETTVSSASLITTPGWNYTRSLVGTLGLFASQVKGVVTAPDFAISADPASLMLKEKTSGTSTIILTSLNGFTGTVNLSATVTPVVKKGLTASLNLVSVTLTANGQGTSTLTVSAKRPTPPGTYTVTVTGVSGTLTHQVQVIVTVITG